MTEKKIGEKKKTPREAKVTFEGLVTEALLNGMFRVRLENDTIILGYISGKIRSSSIRILMGPIDCRSRMLRPKFLNEARVAYTGTIISDWGGRSELAIDKKAS